MGLSTTWQGMLQFPQNIVSFMCTLKNLTLAVVSPLVAGASHKLLVDSAKLC